jgi:hypothetical protein
VTDLSQVIRWNANFVRGLAQSVLERAKVVRGSLEAAATPSKTKKAPAKSKKAPNAKKPKAAPRRKKLNG